MTALLEVDGLSVSFGRGRDRVDVLDRVSLTVGRGEVVGLVGESGSGKSVTSMAVMGLLGANGRVSGGAIRLDGRELVGLPEKEMLRIRGRSVAMIFQEPMTSLNPLFRAGFQIGEVLEVHLGIGRAEARARAVELMHAVGIPAPEIRVDEYPHQLSGGMRQRVMIAMAMACRPRLLLADEPTTALDVTIQAQILDLMRRLKDDTGMSILMITHDLGVIADMADRVVVMYAGRVAEEAPAARLFADPRHPYTRLLLRSLPRIREKAPRLHAIAGATPSPRDFPPGCRFAPRCPAAADRCRAEAPSLAAGPDGRRVACWRADEPGLFADAAQ
jgi:oligopeptide/dipeptide ABC transporter ATP-binding protein